MKMSENQCFKIKRGTEFDKAVKEHFNLKGNWKTMFKKVGALLDEDIHEMALVTDNLYVNMKEIKKDENKKIFTADGRLKQNTKIAKQVLIDYKRLIEESGLSNYQELRLINFIYGVMRIQGQELASFRTSEDDIYYKANFDLEQSSNGVVEPISEIEYEEKYLSELKLKEEFKSA